MLAAALISPLRLTAGAEVPFMEDFQTTATGALPEGWLALDLNGDGKTWGGYYGQIAISDFFAAPVLNDWVFTAPISLEAGKTYLIEMKLTRGYAGGNPTAKVYLGAAQTPESMTDLLLEKELTDYFADPSQMIVKCEATGDYVIGVYGIAEGACIQLDDVSVREANMPAAPTDIDIVKSTTYGSPNVTVRFRAPSADMSGKPLESLSRISVTRSGVNVKEIENPAPGELIEFEDICAYGSGNYVWKVTPYGADEAAGMSAESKPVFVGVNAPGIPQNLTVTEDGHTGVLTVTWDEVTEDREGLPMPAEFIDYQVIFNGSYIELTGATSPYTIVACEPGEQDFAIVQIVAKSNYGSGVAAFGPIVVGTPRTSFVESFDEGVTHSNLRPEGSGQTPASWYVFDDGMLYMYTGLTNGDADQTNGCAAIMGTQSGAIGGVQLGKFDLTGIENPALTFYTYFTNGETEGARTTNRFELFGDTGNGFETIATYDMADDTETVGWGRIVFPLDKVKCNDINLRLWGTIVNNSFCMVDALRVHNYCDRNLAVASIQAPAQAKPDAEIRIFAKVENLGVEDMEESTAVLMRNGKAVNELPVCALDCGHSTTISFFDHLSLLDGDNVEYQIVISESDDDDSDNASAVVTVSNLLPRHPAVTDLKAEINTEEIPASVELTWSEPEMTVVAEPITESFEDGIGGTINSYDEWIFVDLDEEPTYIIDDYDPLPGQGQKMAAFIVDATGHRAPYEAHSGSKFIAMQPCEEMDTDDWLISPELTGDAQTVTFFARSYDQYGYFRENFSFEISSASAEPADFTPAASGQPEYGVPGSWTEYSFELPEGTRYFAIHYNPGVYDGLMLMLDDFSFIPASAAAPLVLQGYNVYRNGQLLAGCPVTESAYSDASVAPGDYEYQVTALYDRGESRGSNVEDVTVSDFTSVRTQNLGAMLRIVKGGIELNASDASRCAVTRTDGVKIADKTLIGREFISLPQGIYMVEINGKLSKVIVR